MSEKPNTFQEMEDNKKNSGVTTSEPKVPEPIKSKGEVDIAGLSDVAIKDQVKYVRPDLAGTEDVVSMFQIFTPDIVNEEAKPSQSGTSSSWKVSMILTYDSVNGDGVNNREYISGARCFKQRDGSASPISFWYDGSETQSAHVWKLVAEKLEKEPAELSPREFAAFLNSKPKVKIDGLEYKNYNAAAGSPAKIKKNMPGHFL